MTIINSKYKIKNENGHYDTVHFETGANQVILENGLTVEEQFSNYIVNDLMSGGDARALSAEMGKELLTRYMDLMEEHTKLLQRVNTIEEKLRGAGNILTI